MFHHDGITQLELLATIGAALGAALYYYAGRRYFGADDDWWSPLRHAVLPRLGRLAARYVEDGYATVAQDSDEYAATVRLEVDALERHLERHGAVKNPWAAAKTSPDGDRSAASWAVRRVRLPVLRTVLALAGYLPIAGDVVRTLEAVLALRQVHLTIYDNHDGTCEVYAHEEPNSINPLTGYAHYAGERQTLFGREWPGKRTDVGVRWVRTRLARWGVPFQTLDGEE